MHTHYKISSEIGWKRIEKISVLQKLCHGKSKIKLIHTDRIGYFQTRTLLVVWIQRKLTMVAQHTQTRLGKLSWIRPGIEPVTPFCARAQYHNHCAIEVTLEILLFTDNALHYNTYLLYSYWKEKLLTELPEWLEKSHVNGLSVYLRPIEQFCENFKENHLSLAS